MITKEYLSNYTYLKQCIEDTEKKIDYYNNHPPIVEYGKVYGSSKDFPYTLRSFSISGYNGQDGDKWRNKVGILKLKLEKQYRELEEMKLDIELYIQDIPDISTRLMFSYIYINDMKQEDAAKKLHVERSTISKRIFKYLDGTNLQLSHNSQLN